MDGGYYIVCCDGVAVFAAGDDDTHASGFCDKSQGNDHGGLNCIDYTSYGTCPKGCSKKSSCIAADQSVTLSTGQQLA